MDNTLGIVMLVLCAIYVLSSIVVIIVKWDKIKAKWNTNNYKKRYLNNCNKYCFAPVVAVAVSGIFGLFFVWGAIAIIYLGIMHTVTGKQKINKIDGSYLGDTAKRSNAEDK